MKKYGRLTSESLAVLIVDGLVYANQIANEKFEEAVKPATDEIDRRKKAIDTSLYEIIPSKSLAVLVVNRLIDLGLIKQENFEEAVRIATLEIDIRKHAGDY